MRASCEEDDFNVLIRLRLLSPVNPKTGAKKGHLWLDDDEAPLAFARKAKMFCRAKLADNERQIN
jgi:hypothetical protein